MPGVPGFQFLPHTKLFHTVTLEFNVTFFVFILNEKKRDGEMERIQPNCQKVTKWENPLLLTVWNERLNIWLNPRLRLNGYSTPWIWQSGSHTTLGIQCPEVFSIHIAIASASKWWFCFRRVIKHFGYNIHHFLPTILKSVMQDSAKDYSHIFLT